MKFKLYHVNSKRNRIIKFGSMLCNVELTQIQIELNWPIRTS